MNAHCLLCAAVLDDVQATLDHLRTVHPESYGELLRWPDGTPVVVEGAPDDFGGAA